MGFFNENILHQYIVYIYIRKMSIFLGGLYFFFFFHLGNKEINMVFFFLKVQTDVLLISVYEKLILLKNRLEPLEVLERHVTLLIVMTL